MKLFLLLSMQENIERELIEKLHVLLMKISDCDSVRDLENACLSSGKYFTGTERQ